ncbi:MAG TPA: type II toxin-antitoxin system RelE/ParE family toxin [Verrucomicrobiae bacterium]|nr:type II toxin-antitoxin system RelE/ParE family toxin [Verrucomicrobiae bacterium]
MAFKIIWSQQARDDLQAVVLFIAQNNLPVAESFGYLLMSKVDVLAQFPQIGRVVPEENDETIREIIFRSYRLIYKILAGKEMVAIARRTGNSGQIKFLIPPPFVSGIENYFPFTFFSHA